MSNRYIGGVITETVNVAQSPWSGEWTPQAELQGTANGNWPPMPAVINNSLRFRASASAYLNRTPGSAGNQKTWTWSGWVKRGHLGVAYDPIFVAGSSGSAYSALFFRNDSFVAFSYSGATEYLLYPTQVFRDPSAWYHIVVAFDSTQATSTNRLKMYVNGVQVTSFSTATYPSQNYSDYFDSTSPHYFCQFTPAFASFQFDGYLADINFIDGQALTPNSFGQYNGDTGVWSATRYTGTYGTNGFHLNFSDGTSTTTLGYDSSGNGNNWTCNNISLTAGSTYDWMIDSPMPTAGSSYGVGNYCTLNPLYKVSPLVIGDGYSTLSNANLTSTGVDNVTSAGTFGVSSGKWYFEIVRTSGNAGDTNGVGFYLSGPNIAAVYRDNGYFRYAGTETAYGASWDSNNIVIGVALDVDNTSITFYKDGVSQGVAKNNLPAGTWIPLIWNRSASTIQANFGQRPFSYTPPSGYKTLCTYNLPASTILNGAKYMAATLWTGTGASSLSLVNSGGFQPDLVWTKARSAAYDALITDSVRGAGKSVTPSSTAAEVTNNGNGYISAFNSNGFSLAQGASSIVSVNESGTTYVGWQWKAGGTAVTNTAGSITSSVSANTTSGFSVVTYTGTGSTGTVGHGLGVAPVMIIYKKRSTTSNWVVMHTALGNMTSADLFLNTTGAIDTLSSPVSAPTTTTFGVSNSVAGSSETCVAYCFAEIPGYSAFGSYTGNGSTDGPFIYCGFRPRFVMTKMTTVAGEPWTMWDSSRGTYNVITPRLTANSANAENSYYSAIDFVSNGFKIRDADIAWNGSGQTYIYAAFAENPFANALAR